MSEIKLVVDQVKFTYEGLFDLNGFYRLIDSFFYEKNYDRYEKVNQEFVTPTGKHIRIEYCPFKNVSDYFKIMVKIRCHFVDVVKVEVEHEGAKVRLDKGRVMLVFDGYVMSDRYDVWSKKPFHWFIRTIFDKYIFKDHYLKHQRWLISDLDDVYAKIKSFFNVYRYYGKTMVEAIGVS